MNAKEVFNTVRQAASSIDFCKDLVRQALANKEPGYGWQWSKTIAPEWSRFEGQVGYVEYAPYDYQTNDQIAAGAAEIQHAAREELRLFELMALVGSNPEDAEMGVIRALRGIYTEKRTRKGFEIHPETDRVTWKDGYDFRSAAPYIFIRLDGREVISKWPRLGTRSNWLD